MKPSRRSEALVFVLAAAAIALIIAACRTLLPGVNVTTVALALLQVVLAVAAVSTRRVAVTVSLLAFVCFNYFFLPPLYTFAIESLDNWVALFALLAVSIVASHLSLQARTRAEQAQNAEAKAALVASLSHDLKTPLTALTIAAENLASPALDPEERAEQAQIARSELDRLRRLFDNVVDMASVHANAVSVEREWTAPTDIIEGARRHVEARLSARPVDVDDGCAALLVKIDPRLTSAAVAHVIENAAIYSPEGTPISIRMALDGGRLRIDVADRGPGLSPDEIGRVFDRFYRGAAGRADRFSSGMGLAIARGLLRLENGEISAATRAGGGTVFTIDVPVDVRPAPDLPGDDA